MLPLFACTLDWSARPAGPMRRWLLVAVATLLAVGCAVNPVPTPSKSGGNQYEGKDADAGLVAADAVAGAADAAADTADAVSGAVDGTQTSADASSVDSAGADTDKVDTTDID
jgi:hypothetical protein